MPASRTTEVVVDKVLTCIGVGLFFLGCAYVGWYAGRTFPWWLVVLFFSLVALVFLDRQR